MRSIFLSLACAVSLCTAFRSMRITKVTTLQMASVEVTPAMVKELREKSGAGMLDCRKALVESGGNIEGAVDWLRKKGLAAVAKKAGRVASSGLVGVAVADDYLSAAVVEINSETDFVARNELFQSMIKQVCSIAAASPHDVTSLAAAPFVGESKTVGEEITRLVATIGENMSLRRIGRLSVSSGHVSTYMHSATKPGLGKIGVAVALESASTNKEKLAELGKNIALHVAASNPDALTIDQVKPEALEREKAVLVDQARASGKPEAAIEKMVEGRLRKYYEEVVLLEQAYVMDSKVKVGDLVKSVSKELGTPITLSGFVRFALGDGLAKKDEE